jgi:hypothetical protein
VRNFARSLGLGSVDVIQMPSTLCPVTGYLYGIQMPVTLSIPAVLMDAWNAAAADLVDRHGVTLTIGATPFLQELAQFSEREKRPFPSLRLFANGGAPVPPGIIYTAERASGDCRAFRVFGSTEAPTVTLGVLDETAADLRANTDGRVVGHEVRILRPDGSRCDDGEEGEIVTRGPELGRFGRTMRLESWSNAQDGGIAVARAIMGDGGKYDPIPWFWSDQYRVNLQVLGIPEPHHDVIVRGDVTSGAYSLIYMNDRAIAAAVSINQPRDNRILRKMMENGKLLDRRDLADITVNLPQALGAGVTDRRGLS